MIKITPEFFDFVLSWSLEDKKLATAITVNHVGNYKKWLEDPFSDAFVGIMLAYKNYGEAMRPIQLVGYIKEYLNIASAKKQKWFKSVILEDDIFTNYILEEVAEDDGEFFLQDVQNVLTLHEFELFYHVVILENPCKTYSEKTTFHKILQKLKKSLYADR